MIGGKRQKKNNNENGATFSLFLGLFLMLSATSKFISLIEQWYKLQTFKTEFSLDDRKGTRGASFSYLKRKDRQFGLFSGAPLLQRDGNMATSVSHTLGPVENKGNSSQGARDWSTLHSYPVFFL